MAGRMVILVLQSPINKISVHLGISALYVLVRHGWGVIAVPVRVPEKR